MLMLPCLLVKVGHERRAVVLFDDVYDGLGQFVLFRELGPFLDVVCYDHGAHMRRQLVVFARRPALVLYKIFRHFYLSYIVVIGAHPREQGIDAYRLRGRFHKIADDDAVVIGARRCYHQHFHEGLVQVKEFEKAYVRGDLEGVLQKRQQHRDDGRYGQAGKNRKGHSRQESPAEDFVFCYKQNYRDDDISQDNVKTASQQRGPPLAPDDAEGGGQAPYKGVNGKERVVEPEAAEKTDGEGEGNGGMKIKKQGHQHSAGGNGYAVYRRVLGYETEPLRKAQKEVFEDPPDNEGADDHEPEQQQHVVIVYVRRFVAHDVPVKDEEEHKGDQGAADEPFGAYVHHQR